jgi:hypothetical protein
MKIGNNEAAVRVLQIEIVTNKTKLSTGIQNSQRCDVKLRCDCDEAAH